MAKAAAVGIAFVTLPLLGGAVGFGGYLVAARALEARIAESEAAPRLSYGQQAALISLLITTLIGFCVGLGAAMALGRQRAFSICVLLATGVAGCALIAMLWGNQVARYGRDPSEAVLYYPPLVAALLAMAAAATLGVAPLVARRRRTSHGDEAGP
ncbi:MAG: hypothetical protein AAF790_11775 [Planctomycetota bacterium]